MPIEKKVKVKIVFVKNYYSDYESILHKIDESDWEEITEEQYKLISENIDELSKVYDGTPVLVLQDPEPIQTRISEIVEVIKQKEIEKEERRKIREQKKKEREAKKEEKKRKEELKKLEELKKKYELAN